MLAVSPPWRVHSREGKFLVPDKSCEDKFSMAICDTICPIDFKTNLFTKGVVSLTCRSHFLLINRTFNFF